MTASMQKELTLETAEEEEFGPQPISKLEVLSTLFFHRISYLNLILFEIGKWNLSI